MLNSIHSYNFMVNLDKKVEVNNIGNSLFSIKHELMFFVMVLNLTSNNMLSCTDNSRIEDGQIEFSLQNNVKMSNEDFESDFNNTIKKVKEFFWNKISTKITSIEVKRNDFCVESYTLY